jgi:hypothetical protein
MAADRAVTTPSSVGADAATTPPEATVPSPSTAADTTPGCWALPVLRWVLRLQRRALLGWGVAMAAVSAIYVSFWPAMGDTGEMQALVDSMPEALVTAMGYDAIGIPAGYLESTVYACSPRSCCWCSRWRLGSPARRREEEAGSSSSRPPPRRA